tara:strand:- start:75 stop:725 length:651 start_codon:yes stop_codon:yes gene_type:complete
MMREKALLLGVYFLVLIVSRTELLANEKFEVADDTLIYSGDYSVDEDDDAEIDWDDVDALKSLLLENPNVKTLQLNASGGYTEAAYEMSDIIIDFGLDTFVAGECVSACTLLFLAGNKRILQRGSKIGFHQSYWEPQDIREYYESEKEYEGWNDEFEFAAWLYRDTQSEIFLDMEYLLERGVSPEFAIQTFKATENEMWYPRRLELIEAGFITDLD